jgi:hypothetical protein
METWYRTLRKYHTFVVRYIRVLCPYREPEILQVSTS